MCEDDDPKSAISLIIVLAGSAISLISICTNVILFLALIRNSRCFQCYFHFILVLAFFDIIISLFYMPVILVDTLKDWTKWIELARAWWPFFVYGLTITHISMTTASFILLSVVFERFLITIRYYRLKQFQAHRSFICFICLLLGISTKGGMLFELDVFPNEDPTCMNTVLEYYVDVTDITKTVWYGTIYKFWFRNFATVFLPFFLLMGLNMKMVIELRRQMRSALVNKSRRRFSLRMQSKKNVRQATSTMLFVCLSYLIANLINVFITAWEFIDMKSLVENFFDEYMLSADISSLLVVSACALRLPIYMVCNPDLRRTVKRSVQHKSDHRDKIEQTFSLITKIVV
ncbi:unnamed protein product [Caenorhabditis bovis]|uniref:G-protein coupled receptors family 1 profile domain-containing protein n=1 Tax=Caenorhabditis bovis TaxID=2654633 RepID=A0A8S1EZD5_9PELO|nr:unnamed protein product [Caenorhabditis bovis]